mgnify:CR=1 FL=1
MRGGVFSGEAAELDADEQLRLVREAPEMSGQNLSAEVSVAARNAPRATVVSGPVEAVEALGHAYPHEVEALADAAADIELQTRELARAQAAVGVMMTQQKIVVADLIAKGAL